MVFLLNNTALHHILRARDKPAHYSLSADWFNGFAEAEGCFFETKTGVPGV